MITFWKVIRLSHLAAPAKLVAISDRLRFVDLEWLLSFLLLTEAFRKFRDLSYLPLRLWGRFLIVPPWSCCTSMDSEDLLKHVAWDQQEACWWIFGWLLRLFGKLQLLCWNLEVKNKLRSTPVKPFLRSQCLRGWKAFVTIRIPWVHLSQLQVHLKDL